MFRITIEENEVPMAPGAVGKKLYEQSVDQLDLRRVIDAINYKPRIYKARVKKGAEQA